jgi:hypothetical protein
MFVFEILHGALMLFGCRPRGKCAQIPALARSRVQLSRVQAILPVLEFSDHRYTLQFPSLKRKANA